MVKSAPKPFSPISNSFGGAQAQQLTTAAPASLEDEGIHILDEHINLPLRELYAESKKLSTQIEDLMVQRRSIDGAISQRHQNHKNMRDWSELTPEEAEDVSSGQVDLQHVLQQKQELRVKQTQELKASRNKSSE